jgi:hypothetical protein
MAADNLEDSASLEYAKAEVCRRERYTVAPRLSRALSSHATSSKPIGTTPLNLSHGLLYLTISDRQSGHLVTIV